MSDQEPTVLGSPVRSLTGVRIVGTGSYLPDKVVTNEDLAELGHDSDWIVRRTGIRERRHVAEGMSTGDLAAAAAEKAIEASGVPRNEIDLVVLATLSPDKLMPATATTVQHQLGLRCGAVDVSAACSGFTYALATGMQFIATGACRSVLVIGADANSRVVDPRDEKTFPLFGDGAGAVVLAPGEDDQGAVAYTLGADGSGIDLLSRPTGGAETPFAVGRPDDGSWFMQMDGRAVFKWAVRLVERSARRVCDGGGFTPGDVRWWMLHQANARILDAAVEGLEIDHERVLMHLDRYGNTSAGTVPILLDEAVRGGRVSRGDLLMMIGFGAGLTWGTIAWRW